MKVGILGCAHMHVHSYTEAFKKLDIQICAVYDDEQSSAKAFAQAYDLPVCDTLSQFYTYPFDTVVICSENSAHLKHALSAAENKRHVIVEKPVALSLKEVDQMIASTEKNAVKLLVCHPVRYAEPIQELKKAIDDEQLGEIYAINATNHGKNPGGWFVDPSRSGGGALVDHTIHIADLIYWLFDLSVDQLTAYKETLREDLEVEDTGLIHGTLTNGAIFSIDTSWNRPVAYPAWGDAILEIISEKGRTVVDGFGRRATTYSNNEHHIDWTFYESDMDFEMIKAFVKTIDDDLPSPVDGEAGRYTVDLFNRAYDAIEKMKS